MNQDIAAFVDKLQQLARKEFPLEPVKELFNTTTFAKDTFTPYTFFSDDFYTRNLITGNKDFELILVCWQPGQAAPVHGHEGQKCWMKVLEGRLRFINYTEKHEDDPADLKVVKDEVGLPGYFDGPAYIHSVENCGDTRAMSLHLYANPFHDCTVYKLDAHTMERRHLGFYSKEGKKV